MEITFYRKLANKLADAVIGNHQYPEADAKRIRYGLICIFSDLYKSLLFLIIFSLLSLTKEFLIAFIVITILRPFLGGFHAKTELTCIIMSFIMLLISILAGSYNLIPYHLQIILLILFPLVGFIIAPVKLADQKQSINIPFKLLTALLTIGVLLINIFVLPGQILFWCVIQVYLLAFYQLTKNYIYKIKFM